ncbi:MAG: NUDIX domain-containing protein [Candidatus Omnitrophica bacterium]|nr:NUDIX domain-containing protein [Candidatus Omnitrophota bacterium]
MNKPFYMAVRGILYDAQNRVLLLQRAAASKNQPLFWEFPGGKVDPGENFADALVREFQEETGLTVSLEKVFGCGEWEREDYRIAYLFMLVTLVSGEVQISREHDAFAWMSALELEPAKVSPQLEKLRQAVMAVMPQPPTPDGK